MDGFVPDVENEEAFDRYHGAVSKPPPRVRVPMHLLPWPCSPMEVKEHASLCPRWASTMGAAASGASFAPPFS